MNTRSVSDEDKSSDMILDTITAQLGHVDRTRRPTFVFWLALLLPLVALAVPDERQRDQTSAGEHSGSHQRTPVRITAQDPLRNRIAAPTSLFAHIVVGGGYSTSFTFLNTGGADLNGTLTLAAADGKPLTVIFSSAASGSALKEGNTQLQADSTLSFAIRAGGACFISISAPHLDDSKQAGWARVTSFGGSLGGTATFLHRDAAGRLTTSAGVLSGDAVEAARIPIDDDRSQHRYTGFAIANCGTDTLSVRGEVVEGDRGTTISTFSLSLEAGQQLARFLFEVVDLPEQFRGSVVLTRQQGDRFPVVALAQVAGLYTAVPAVPVWPAPRSILALTNATIIDGTGAAPVRDGAVVIYDDRIAAAGARSGVNVPPGARIIDVHQGTVLPGFFNTHVHSAYSEGNLRAWAQAGVTTVRDMGFGGGQLWWPLSFRDEHATRAEFARIIAVGPMISTPGGYPVAVWGGIGYTAGSETEARLRTNEVLDHGADLIKTTLESGLVMLGRASLPEFSEEEAKAILDVAHHRGVPVSVHVTSVMDLAKAVDYGFDEVAHMVADTLQDDRLIARMVAKDIYWIPTLELWSNYGLDQVATANLHRFISAGGKVALGTDFSGAPKPFQLGMPTLEMKLMLQSGMTPMQIIVSATKNAAHVCNLERFLGTIEPGKVADLLVVDGDPLQDINALGRVQLVMRNGTVIKNTID